MIGFVDNTRNVINNPPIVGSIACNNSPKRLAHMARTSRNSRKAEINKTLLQIIHANPYACLNHEGPYTHLTKLYEIVGMLGALEEEEEFVFMRLFPHSLIGKANDWYLDQPAQIMTNWNILEEKFLNRFFPNNKFSDTNIAITVFA